MKKKIFYILFLLTALFSYGQVTLAISEVKESKINQRLNLTILLEISGENMQQETPLRMPDLSKFDIVGSASEQNTIVVDSKRGDIVNQMIYQLVLTPKQAGKLKFGSVLVTVNGKIYKTEPFDINVRDIEKKTSIADNYDHNEIHLNWEVQDKTVYKNQPAIAVLKAYSRNYGNFRKIGTIHYSQQKNANIKPLSFAKSEIETNDGVASQTIASFMIFPAESGNIEINPVSATINIPSKEHKISSNKLRLNVQKLPSGMPSDYKNAVGKFDMQVANINQNEFAEIEKPVTISMKVSGVGNLNSMHIPRIVHSENYAFFTPKITSKTVNKTDGVSGDIVANYVVIPKKSGNISVDFENFSYFDPQSKEYVDLGAKSVVLNVKTHEQVAESKTTLEKVNEYTNAVLETVNTPVLQTHNLKVKDKNKINWKIVFGNLALMTALLSLFLVIRKRMKLQKLEPANIPTKNITNIAETEELLRNDMSHHIDDNIEYLKKLKENKDYTNFFKAYDELNNDARKIYSAETEHKFRVILEETKGQTFAEKYRVLSEQIQFEKYAPYHVEEQIDELLKSIISIYSEIK